MTTKKLISHELDNQIIRQRSIDGYIDATSMCQAKNKRFNDYSRLGSSKAFIQELSSDTGIPVSGKKGLVQQIKGGRPEDQGTWVHPQIAINLGQWLSPGFAVQVSKWVFAWMSGGQKVMLPYHLQRYLVNSSQIPHTHFSMLTEMAPRLIAPLESMGYELPEKLVPDISEGRMFSGWLREKGIKPEDFPTYIHRYDDGREVSARLYPNKYLADFIEHFNETWLYERARGYFQKKDPRALPYLKKVIALNERNQKKFKNK
ncbi:KilA-N domain-containing protein [Patescibacteria group bacterium]